METPAKVELLMELMKFSDAQVRRELKSLEDFQIKQQHILQKGRAEKALLDNFLNRLEDK